LFSGLVPSNASGFFESRGSAIEQEPGRIEIAYSEQGYLFNSAFRPELIALDENYMTQVTDLNFSTVVPTLGYFKEACHGLLESGDTIVDIGCGQGEFVSALRTEGFDAHGFDPVLKTPSPFLHPHFWEPGLIEAKLFVMRCVLPHFYDPWNFFRGSI
jgi:hypothetical protein